MKTERKTIELTLTRTIDTRPEAVYDVWLDDKSPGGPWFGAAKSILNPVVDGLFYTAAEHEGRRWPHYGRFVRLERGRVIEHTWVSESTRGWESVLTITLAPKGDQTELVLRHSGLPDDDDARKHEEGWAWVLSCIIKRFE